MGFYLFREIMAGVTLLAERLTQIRGDWPMALTAAKWSGNARLQAAARNAPPLKPFERDHVAVRLLQETLIAAGFPIPSGPTGNYLTETAAAVRKCEEKFRLTVRDSGIAGREVLSALDAFLRGAPGPSPAPVPPPAPATRRSGASLAKADAPLALAKVQRALKAISDATSTLVFNSLIRPGEGPPRPFDPVTVEALRTHFKLETGTDVIAPPFQTMDLGDLNFIRETYGKIQQTITTNSTMFVDGSPTDKKGKLVVAAAPLKGPIQFSTLYRDFTAPDGQLIGPNSRAAVVMHEATHVVDGESGIDDVTHISEFSPAYAQQAAQLAIHNPSSYASFAAHVVLGRDPPQRFGLGPGRFL